MIKYLPFVGVLLILGLSACKQEKQCPDKVCTMEFAYLTIKFLDKNNEPVNIKNYSAVNQRTHDTIKSTMQRPIDDKGVYIVMDDSYTSRLSEQGDNIKVSGTDSIGNQTKTAIVKVSGGKCACHINKISGPDIIRFD